MTAPSATYWSETTPGDASIPCTHMHTTVFLTKTWQEVKCVFRCCAAWCRTFEDKLNRMKTGYVTYVLRTGKTSLIFFFFCKSTAFYFNYRVTEQRQKTNILPTNAFKHEGTVNFHNMSLKTLCLGPECCSACLERIALSRMNHCVKVSEKESAFEKTLPLL